MPATVQGLNLINVLANGTINSTELETALTTDSLDGSFEGALSSGPIQTWLGNSTNAPDIIAGSATALATVMSITGAAASLISNNNFADLVLANSTYRDIVLSNEAVFAAMVASEGGAQALADNSTACVQAMSEDFIRSWMVEYGENVYGQCPLEIKIQANSSTMSALISAAPNTITDTNKIYAAHYSTRFTNRFVVSVNTGYTGNLANRRISSTTFTTDAYPSTTISIPNNTVSGSTFTEAQGRFYDGTFVLYPGYYDTSYSTDVTSVVKYY